MFQECKEIEYLDLSNFDTSNVSNSRCMFFGCDNLKTLNILNFSLKDNACFDNMFSFESKKNCNFIAKNKILKNEYNSE